MTKLRKYFAKMFWNVVANDLEEILEEYIEHGFLCSLDKGNKFRENFEDLMRTIHCGDYTKEY